MNHWTIQNRILFLALLPGVLVTLVLGIFFMTERARDLNSLQNERALAMVKQLAPTSEYGVMTGSIGILQNIANSMLEERDVRAVSIFNPDMQTLAHAGPRMHNERKNSEQLLEGQLLLRYTPDSVRARAPVYAQNLLIDDNLDNFLRRPVTPPQKLLGWVELELSLQNSRLQHYQHLVSSLSVILVVLIVCSLVVIRMSRQVSHPMQHIARAMKDLEDGKLETRVHIDSGGEFQQLASGINAMASALQRANTEHQHNLEQTTRDLQETLDELEIRNRELAIGRKEALDASRMKSEFLANVSHEIRTPLNGIIGFSELLARTQVNDRQTDYLDTIRRSSSDLLKIINDILDLSKIDAGKLIIEHTELNLRDVIEEVLTVLAPEANRKQLELNYLIYSEVPVHILGDPLRLKQVLTNLISNAIKFTERGNVSVRVALINRSEDRAAIQFEVQDSGIGMTEAQQDKLFSAFSQADASTARKYGGTGLGLIISRALVEAMHGEIAVTSHPGRGSTFSFHIEAGLQQQPADDLMPLTGHCIALLEPTLFNRMNISNLLQEWRIDVEDISNQEQLLDILNQPNRPEWQVLLLSAGGQQTIPAALLSRLQQQGIKVIAMTGQVSHDQHEALRQAGAHYTLSQPFSHRQLHRLIAQALDITVQQDNPLCRTRRPTAAPRILAVDDNNANLKLVVTLLEELALPVMSAASGQEAITIVQQHTVDLILMDIQMPGMNGLEATSHIRALPEGGAMPIVALTAHAMSDEKEALLKAGMNDYQTKPISQEQLANCIERWTGYHCPLTPVAAPEVPALPVNACDWVFDTTIALRHANQNAALAMDMFRMLLDSLALDIPGIVDAWEQEDMQQLLERVHRLHGASRYCGVPCLRGTLERLETALKSHHSAALPDLMRQLVEDSANLQHWAHSNDWEYLLQRKDGNTND